MRAGVARQCLRNRCLPGDGWMLHRGRRAEQVDGELEERPSHGPDPRFLCLQPAVPRPPRHLNPPSSRCIPVTCLDRLVNVTSCPWLEEGPAR
jgi:hypothetical protein